jgi:hypothetical protein
MIAVGCWLLFWWLWGVLTGIDLILDQAALPREGYWHTKVSWLMLIALLASVVTTAYVFVRPMFH